MRWYNAYVTRRSEVNDAGLPCDEGLSCYGLPDKTSEGGSPASRPQLNSSNCHCGKRNCGWGDLPYYQSPLDTSPWGWRLSLTPSSVPCGNPFLLRGYVYLSCALNNPFTSSAITKTCLFFPEAPLSLNTSLTEWWNAVALTLSPHPLSWAHTYCKLEVCWDTPQFLICDHCSLPSLKNVCFLKLYIHHNHHLFPAMQMVWICHLPQQDQPPPSLMILASLI